MGDKWAIWMAVTAIIMFLAGFVIGRRFSTEMERMSFNRGVEACIKTLRAGKIVWLNGEGYRVGDMRASATEVVDSSPEIYVEWGQEIHEKLHKQFVEDHRKRMRRLAQ